MSPVVAAAPNAGQAAFALLPVFGVPSAIGFFATTTILTWEGQPYERDMRLKERDMGNLSAKGMQLSLLTVVIGAVLLGFFKAVFPGIATAEVIAVIALAAVVLSLGIHSLWGRRHRERDEGSAKK